MHKTTDTFTPPTLEKDKPAVLPLEWLHVDPQVTCRTGGKADPKLVKLIAQAFKAGGEVEPAKVAMLNGRWTLIDGLHRYEAFAEATDPNADRERARFPVVSLGQLATVEEARWLASKLNWTAKKSLTPKERRDAFRRFVQANAHRKGHRGRGAFKSYREIEADLPGAKRATLHRWMQQDFPSVAAAMAKDPENVEGKGGDRDWKEIKAERQAAQIRDRLVAFGSAEHSRALAIRAAEEALWKLTGEAPRLAPPCDQLYDFK